MRRQMIFNKKNWKVILWGHKLHSHTHSYVQNAFYRAFQHLGVDTFWFDDSDDISWFDFKNCLFITEGQVCHKIPLRDDCVYVLHNCDSKFDELRHKNRAINLQVYTDYRINSHCLKIDEGTYYDVPSNTLYMLWGTDLLPNEIEENKPKYIFNSESKIVSWIGTIGGEFFGNENQISPFIKACEENGIVFEKRLFQSIEENIQLIKNSYMAPTIVGRWQQQVGYCPCRIFKNISYGQFGITNSLRVSSLFDNKIIYNEDTYQLFYDAKSYLSNMHVKDLHDLMDIVKEKHTYLNRINTILDFILKVNPKLDGDLCQEKK